LQSIATQIGSDTFIYFAAGDTLTLADVALADLTSGDFAFEAAHGPIIDTTQQNFDTLTGTFSGFSISDDLDSVDDLTVTVVAEQGFVAPHGTADGVSVQIGVDETSGSGILLASGTLNAINDMLAEGIDYAPDFNNLPLTDRVSVTVQDGQSAVDEVNLIFNVTGAGPSVTLNGTPGKDVLYSTGYDDTLTGGASSDTFVFRPVVDQSGQTFGNDTITDFNVLQDFLNIDHTNFANVTDAADFLQNYAADDGNGGTVINIDANNKLVLSHVTPQELAAHQNHILVV
jgi:hypothetical protein